MVELCGMRQLDLRLCLTIAADTVSTACVPQKFQRTLPALVLNDRAGARRRIRSRGPWSPRHLGKNTAPPHAAR